MLALGGGVTVAAEQAKPGDALYEYKVNFNDQVRHEYHVLQASLGAEAKVEDTADADTDSDSDATAKVEAEVEDSGSASGTYLTGSADLDTSVDIEVR